MSKENLEGQPYAVMMHGFVKDDFGRLFRVCEGVIIGRDQMQWLIPIGEVK